MRSCQELRACGHCKCLRWLLQCSTCPHTAECRYGETLRRLQRCNEHCRCCCCLMSAWLTATRAGGSAPPVCCTSDAADCVEKPAIALASQFGSSCYKVRAPKWMHDPWPVLQLFNAHVYKLTLNAPCCLRSHGTPSFRWHTCDTGGQSDYPASPRQIPHRCICLWPAQHASALELASKFVSGTAAQRALVHECVAMGHIPCLWDRTLDAAFACVGLKR